MFYQKDYILRQIETTISALARIIFGKEEPGIISLDEDRAGAGDPLLEELGRLLERGNVNEAEQALFDALELRADPPNRAQLLIALKFYDRLNRWTDAALSAAGYDRSEIREGLAEIARLYGVDII
ncbi:MAG: DUF6483 family protein [Oscillospiraceae bacterium]|jgi:hypothetical protein|nr:DUF6483 family protein [Oscillospiraceae bacterium]